MGGRRARWSCRCCVNWLKRAQVKEASQERDAAMRRSPGGSLMLATGKQTAQRPSTGQKGRVPALCSCRAGGSESEDGGELECGGCRTRRWQSRERSGCCRALSRGRTNGRRPRPERRDKESGGQTGAQRSVGRGRCSGCGRGRW